MLILTRRIGESITIGDDVKVTVIDCQGKQVKLGIIAPKDITIHREEIYERIQDQNKRSANISKRELMEIAQIWRKEIENPGSEERSVTKHSLK